MLDLPEQVRARRSCSDFALWSSFPQDRGGQLALGVEEAGELQRRACSSTASVSTVLTTCCLFYCLFYNSAPFVECECIALGRNHLGADSESPQGRHTTSDRGRPLCLRFDHDNAAWIRQCCPRDRSSSRAARTLCTSTGISSLWSHVRRVGRGSGYRQRRRGRPRASSSHRRGTNREDVSLGSVTIA